MRTRPPSSRRAPAPRAGPPVTRRRPAAPAVLLLAGLTAVLVWIGGGGQLQWLALPVAMVAAALATTRVGSAAAAGVVIGLSIVLSLGVSSSVRPSPLLLLVVAAACAAVLVAVRERLERDRLRLREFALSDPVTGVANRRSLVLRAEYEIERHRRVRRSFALVMIDLDGFKGLNDRYGHAAGDDLLREVATSLAHAMRAQDTVARFGGDEFCILAPETDEAGGERLADRIDRAIRRVGAGTGGAISGSAGIAIFPEDGQTVTALMSAADERLLEAKRVLYETRPRGTRRAA